MAFIQGNSFNFEMPGLTPASVKRIIPTLNTNGQYDLVVVYGLTDETPVIPSPDGPGTATVKVMLDLAQKWYYVYKISYTGVSCQPFPAFDSGATTPVEMVLTLKNINVKYDSTVDQR